MYVGRSVKGGSWRWWGALMAAKKGEEGSAPVPTGALLAAAGPAAKATYVKDKGV